jgi:hypothetical protein
VDKSGLRKSASAEPTLVDLGPMGELQLTQGLDIHRLNRIETITPEVEQVAPGRIRAEFSVTLQTAIKAKPGLIQWEAEACPQARDLTASFSWVYPTESGERELNGTDKELWLAAGQRHRLRVTLENPGLCRIVRFAFSFLAN